MIKNPHVYHLVWADLPIISSLHFTILFSLYYKVKMLESIPFILVMLGKKFEVSVCVAQVLLLINISSSYFVYLQNSDISKGCSMKLQ